MFDPTMLSAPGVTIQGSRVSVDVSHLVAGTEVRVQFDLIGGDSDRLGAVTIDDVAIDADGCPVFPTWEFYGEGLAGTVGVPAITVQQDPQLGTKLSLGLGNSAGAPTVAVGILSLAPDALPTTLVGTLLVSAKPSDLVGVWTLPLPADGELIGHSIPADAPLCGLSVYGQAVVQDPGAPMGWAFTRGVRFVLGG